MKPARFVMEPRQVSAALALAGIPVSARSVLPPPAPDPAALRGSEAMGADGKLRPEAETALRIAADPAQIVSVTASRAGGHWAQAVFLRARGARPLVAHGQTKGRIDLALLPSTAEALLLVDEMLALTDFASRSGDRTVSLDLAGYAALLAASDLLLSMRLEARLNRTATHIPVFSADLLDALLAKGTSGSDFNWAVTTAARLAPVKLEDAKGRVAQGLAGLEAAGLVQTDRLGYYRFTEPGYLAGAMLGEIVTAAGLEQIVARDGAPAEVARVTLFRTAVSIWAATWDTVEPHDARLSLAELSAAAALLLVRSLLEPALAAAPAAAAPSGLLPPVQRTCPACGQRVSLGGKFCSSCGSPLR